MEIILIIDKILALPVVRWLLLAVTVFALAGFGYETFRAWKAGVEISILKAERDSLKAAVLTQNDAIQHAAKQAQEAINQLEASKVQADTIIQATKKAVRDILGKPLTGSCPDMVAESVRILQGAK